VPPGIPDAGTAAAAPTAPAAGLTLVDVRRLWPDIVDATKQRRRLTWIHLTQHAQVVAVDATTLTLGFANAGARESFAKGGSDEIVRQAAIDVVGVDWQVEAIVDPGAQPEPAAGRATSAAEPGRGAPAAPPEPAAEPDEARHEQPDPPVDRAPPAESTPASAPEAVAAARQAIRETRSPGEEPASDELAVADAEAHPDDPEVEALLGAELLQRALGAEVIEEIPHE
jgi:DNA polymerase-3 subunit gamma/tau